MTDYTVKFDGTKKGEWGKYIFGPNHAQVQPQPVSRHYGMTTARVRALRTDARFQDWFTIADVKAATGFDAAQTNSALTNLGKSGDLIREREITQRSNRWGQAQRYRFTR